MKVLLLTNDHRVTVKTVNSYNLEFFNKGKLYAIEATAIGLTQEPNKHKMPVAYALYFENDSNPVTFTAPDPDKEKEDPSLRLLNKVVAINAGRQLNNPSGLGGIVKAVASMAQHLTLINIFTAIVGTSLLLAFLEGSGVV